MPRAALVLIAVLLLAGCGADDSKPEKPVKPAKHAKSKPPVSKPAARPWPKLPRCPSTATNCRTARGTIVYVEAKDPDGDGDAHFVLTSTQSVTSPGITVIDVEKELRPKPLPGIGDRVAAAGPVYRGSYGQNQIQATTLRVAR